MSTTSTKKTTQATKEILKQLIAFSVLGGQSNLSIAKWIESYIRAHDIPFHNVPNEDGSKRSIHCRIGPATDGGTILSGHTDVVPVEGQEWHTDPFEMVEKAGKLYGRGSCDMKGFIACCLATLPEMKKAKLQKPIYFAFSYDEEIGCLAGSALAKAIRSTYHEKPQYAIIGEPSLMHIVTGQKGMGSMETTILSRGAHSSNIATEASAIHEGAKLVLWLENKMKTLVENGKIDPRFNPPHSTLHVGKFNGGLAHNIIADRCTMLWDMRTLPTDNLAEIMEEFNAFCQERMTKNRGFVPEFNISTQKKFPFVLPLDTPNQAEVVNFVAQLTTSNQINTVSFASEAGQFAAEGFDSVICGPGSIEQAHTANEFISLAQLEQGVAFMHRLIEKNRL